MAASPSETSSGFFSDRNRIDLVVSGYGKARTETPEEKQRIYQNSPKILSKIAPQYEEYDQVCFLNGLAHWGLKLQADNQEDFSEAESQKQHALHYILIAYMLDSNNAIYKKWFESIGGNTETLNTPIPEAQNEDASSSTQSSFFYEIAKPLKPQTTTIQVFEIDSSHCIN
jgi:hypothetical protein